MKSDLKFWHLTGILCLFLSLKSQSQVFEKLENLYGFGGVVYEGKNNKLFQLAPYGDGIYRSEDNGYNWQEILPPVSKVSNLSVGWDGSLFCITTIELWKSEDDGDSWISILYPKKVFNTITSLADGTILAFGTTTFYKSNDNGMHWNSTELPDIIQTILFVPENQTVFAISDKNIYISKDTGTTWQLFANNDFASSNKKVIVAQDGSVIVATKFIYRFDYAGQLLNKIDLRPGSSEPVNITMTKSGRLLAYEYSKCFYSDDLGNNWTEFGSINTEHPAFRSFYTTQNGTVFAVKEKGSIHRSEDNGTTWSFSAYGISNPTVNEMEFFSETELLALTNDALWYSNNAGQTWKFIINSHLEMPYGIPVNHLEIYNNEIFFVDYNRIYHFKDWNSIPDTIVKDGLHRLISNRLFINPLSGTLFLRDLTGVYRSIDKGRNWVKMQLSNIESFHAFSDGSIIATNERIIYKSADDGLSWKSVLDPIPGLYNSLIGNSSVAFLNASDMTKKKLSSTIDFGESWQTIKIDNNLNLNDARAMNESNDIFIMGYNNEIFRSRDFGVTFELFSNEISDISRLNLSPNQRIYALTNGKGLYRTKLTTPTNNPPEFSKVDIRIEPNPVSNYAIITVGNTEVNQEYKLTCFDVHSKLQWEKNFNGNQTMISKDQMTSGVYLLILKSEKGIPLKSRKFIVE